MITKHEICAVITIVAVFSFLAILGIAFVKPAVSVQAWWIYCIAIGWLSAIVGRILAT